MKRTAFFSFFTILMALCLFLGAQPAYAEDAPTTWYILRQDGRCEMVDRRGNAPACIDRQFDNAYPLRDEHDAIIAYVLEVNTVSAGIEENKDFDFWQEVQTALMALDGSFLRPFEKGVRYSGPAGGYIVRETFSQDFDITCMLVDQKTGDLREALPGRDVDSVSSCGDGLLVGAKAVGAGKAAADRECFYISADLQVIFSKPANYGYANRWLGETVIALTDTSGALYRSTVYNLKGEALAGPYESLSFGYSNLPEEQTLRVYDQGDERIVDRATGVLSPPSESMIIGTYGDLRMEHKSQDDGANRSLRIVDALGKEILPWIDISQANYSLTDASPILSMRWDAAGNYAVYSRDGKLLHDWAGDRNGGVLQERDEVFIDTGNEIVFYSRDGGERRVSLPPGTNLDWIDDSPGLTAIRFSFPGEEYREQRSAILSADGKTLLEPYYQYVRPLDYVVDTGYKIAEKEVRKDTHYSGLLDQENQLVLPFRCSSITLNGDLLEVSMGSWYGLVDYEGNWIVRRSRLSSMTE